MKVLPVSLQTFKSQLNLNKYNLQYLYTLPEQKKENYTRQYMALTAMAALTAVGVMLFNLSGHRRFPYNISELKDAAKGLNVIGNNEKLINSLKTDFIYPIKAFSLGDKSTKNLKEVKSGLILTGENVSELESIINALTEHFSELGIKTSSIPHISQRIKDGEIIVSKNKRSTLYKFFRKEILKCSESFKEDGKYTVINIGNIDDLTDLKVIKSQNSNFEELLQKLSNDVENHGVIWVGWTNNRKALPLFLSYLPISIKRTA